ncbi:MAG: GlsB/YeaQ/YmgE family stress response membrane protein [Acidobacteria bacterium]|nr:MAG: GlsB/YeaQ/YmgE family stress response membrane protein [Acidobacteriota bacterium]
MYLLAWMIIGAVVGWGSGRVFQGNGYGPFMDILMGVGGAVVGGLLMRSAGYGGTVITALVAMVGAVLVTMLAAYVNGRRVYARQL